jgi:hypothetical protein
MWKQIKQNAKLLAGVLLSALVLCQFLSSVFPNGIGLLMAVALGIWVARANPSWIDD